MKDKKGWPRKTYSVCHKHFLSVRCVLSSQSCLSFTIKWFVVFSQAHGNLWKTPQIFLVNLMLSNIKHEPKSTFQSNTWKFWPRVDSAPGEWFMRVYLFCPGHGLERFTWINGGLKASVKTVSFLKKHLLWLHPWIKVTVCLTRL